MSSDTLNILWDDETDTDVNNSNEKEEETDIKKNE